MGHSHMTSNRLGHSWIRVLILPIFVMVAVAPHVAQASSSNPPSADANSPLGIAVAGPSVDPCIPNPTATTQIVRLGSLLTATSMSASTLVTKRMTWDGGVEYEPPTGWSPLRATDEELGLFGIPERPQDSMGLSEWTNEWSRWRSRASSDTCTRTNASGAIASYNWTGMLDHCAVGYCTKVSGVFAVPSFNVVPLPCAYSVSDMAMWTGFGGNSGELNLIQTGINQTLDPSSSSVDYGWYEYIDVNGKDSTAITWTGWQAHAGDSVQATVWRHTVSGTVVITFDLLNVTTGQDASLSFSSFNGEPLSSYWTGRTAEYIVERFHYSGFPAPGYAELREPYGDAAHFTSDYTNGIAANSATFVPDAFTPMTNPNTGDTLGTTNPNGWGSNASFWSLWHNCY